MTELTKQRAILLAKIGIVGTIIGVPVGLWAMDRWTGADAWKTVGLLTAVSFATKEVMMKRAGHA